MGTSTAGRTARRGRRLRWGTPAALAAVTLACLLAGDLMATASATPTAVAPAAATKLAPAKGKPAPAAAKPAPAKGKPAPAKGKPGAPRTLGALDAAMDAAIQAKGSVAYTHATLAGGQVARTQTGVVSWSKGFASFDVTESWDQVVQHWISLPAHTYLMYEHALPDGGQRPWAEVDLNSADGYGAYLLGHLTLKRQQMNPARLYPGRALAALKVTQGKPVTVGGVRCSVYSVRMTSAQKFGSQPASTRPVPAEQGGGTVTTTYYLDPQGLPRQVVVVNTWASGSYSEVSTFARWGTPVTVEAPEL